MEQPTAEEALAKLEPLIGEWTMEATPPVRGKECWLTPGAPAQDRRTESSRRNF